MRQCKVMKKKIGNFWGVGGLYMTPLERKFRGGRGSNRKNHLYMWGGDMGIFWNHTFYEKSGGSFSENQKTYQRRRTNAQFEHIERSHLPHVFTGYENQTNIAPKWSRVVGERIREKPELRTRVLDFVDQNVGWGTLHDILHEQQVLRTHTYAR